MSFPHPHKAIPFFWLIDLYYKKLYYYTFNLINKNFVEFVSSTVITIQYP